MAQPAPIHDWLTPDVQRRVRARMALPLARAVGMHKQPALAVLDATAGLGRDGYTLAALGATLTLGERDPQTAAELAERHRAARHVTDLAEAAGRIHLHAGDSRLLLRPIDTRFDVVCVDPMFTDAAHSALAKAPIQALRERTRGDPDAADLVDAALASAIRRIVIKRAPKAPPLTALKPTFVLRGTKVRFDVYDRPHLTLIDKD